MSGKGDKRRPSFVNAEEYTLRWDLAFGYISQAEFDVRMKALRRGHSVCRNRRSFKEADE